MNSPPTLLNPPVTDVGSVPVIPSEPMKAVSAAVNCVPKPVMSVFSVVSWVFSCVRNAKMSLVESAGEAAADWAVDAAWVA